MNVARAALLLILACAPCVAQPIVSVSDESDDSILTVVRSAGRRQFVPRAAGNADYAQVLAWVTAGNTITRVDIKPRRKGVLRQRAVDVYMRIAALQRWQADPQRPFELANELADAQAELVDIKNEYQAIGP